MHKIKKYSYLLTDEGIKENKPYKKFIVRKNLSMKIFGSDE